MIFKQLAYKTSSVINISRLIGGHYVPYSYKHISYLSMEPPEKISNCSKPSVPQSEPSTSGEQLRHKSNRAFKKKKGPPRDAHLTHDQFMGNLDLTISDYYFEKGLRKVSYYLIFYLNLGTFVNVLFSLLGWIVHIFNRLLRIATLNIALIKLLQIFLYCSGSSVLRHYWNVFLYE